MKYLKYRELLWLTIVSVIVAIQLPGLSHSGNGDGLFSSSEDCSFCHTSGMGALVDSRGNDLSIYHDWVSSMMANAFRDPFFRAKLASEKKRNPELAVVIEDKCLTCHAPMARTQALHDGAGNYTLAEAEQSDPAKDGVSCTLCHQIQPDNLGAASSFSGHYIIEDRREIYGPYTEVLVQPMLHHLGFLPKFGSQVDDPGLCATCHTLFTPYVGEDGTVAGEFPEQTPYLEWLNSSYSGGAMARSCQDCHMPKIEEYIKITNRPPWYRNKQFPFWKHHFVGANQFVLEMLRANPDELETVAYDAQFTETIKRVEDQLTGRSAVVTTKVIEEADGHILLEVKVENLTGHKFPTGFPSRRAWLRVQVLDSRDLPVFDSGGWSERGEIRGEDEGYEPHHDLITVEDQVQIYQGVMADVGGQPTYTLIEAQKFLKDNRLVPHGYRNSGPMTEFTAISGAAVGDANFNRGADGEGTGADTVQYQIALNGASRPLTVKSTLLYQTLSPRFAGDLIQDGTPATEAFSRMYSSVKNIPLVIDVVTIPVQ